MLSLKQWTMKQNTQVLPKILILIWDLSKLGSSTEMFDTQAASALHGLEVSLSTEWNVFLWHSILYQSDKKWKKALLKHAENK